jgi:invasion protein IalB
MIADRSDRIGPVADMGRDAMTIIRAVAIGAVVGLVTASGPGVAQAQAPAPQGQAAQPAQAPAPAQQPPAAPIRTEILKFDSWTATCNEFEAPKKRTCAAQLQVLQSGSNQVVLTWVVFINDNKQLVTVLQTPTGVTIAPGVKLRLEKAAERTLPFETCDNGQCTASQVLDNNLLRDMGAASSAQVTVQSINGNQVNFNFAVKGIDKALTHLRGKI